MSDALPLPPRPNLNQYRKIAKDFQDACKSNDPGAIRDWAASWIEKITRLRGFEVSAEVRRQIDFEAERMEYQWRKYVTTNDRASQCRLTDAQFFVARGHGFASWPKFVKHLEGLQRADSPISTFEAAVDAIVNGDAAKLETLLRENPRLARSRSTR